MEGGNAGQWLFTQLPNAERTNTYTLVNTNRPCAYSFLSSQDCGGAAIDLYGQVIQASVAKLWSGTFTAINEFRTDPNALTSEGSFHGQCDQSCVLEGILGKGTKWEDHPS